MAVTDYSQYSAPLIVIVRRLLEHQKPGGILDGLKFTPVLRAVEEVGNADTPALRFTGMQTVESHGPRGKNSPGESGNDNAQMDIQTFRFVLYTQNECGPVQLDPVNFPLKKRGHLDWVARIMDAIETLPIEVAADSPPRTDASLEGTVCKPISLRTEETEGLDALLSSIIVVECALHPFNRGQRHLNFLVRPPLGS